MNEDIKIPFDGNDLRVLVDSYEATIKKLDTQLKEIIEGSNERETYYIGVITAKDAEISKLKKRIERAVEYLENLKNETAICDDVIEDVQQILKGEESR